MGVEYRHCFAVSDLNWIPVTDQDFDKFEKNVAKVLNDWELVDECVERRTGSTSLLLNDKGKWVKRDQILRSGVSPLLEKERRVDWKPKDKGESVERIAGKEFEYSGVAKRPEIQWIHIQLGPNYKIYGDPYDGFERHDKKPFTCSKCKKTAKEIDDPYVPGMIDQHTICQSVCDCGAEIQPAEIKFTSDSDDHAPDIGIWRAALFIDFGKCHPNKVLWSGRMQSREFINDLEKAFGHSLVEFGAWY